MGAWWEDDPVTVCDHVWPDELTMDTECVHCGLRYWEWEQ